MNQLTKENLIAARKLIEKPENWAKEYYAFTANGEKISEQSKEAHCFCSLGAIYRAATNIGQATNAYLARIELEKAIKRVYGSSTGHVPTFNDSLTTTHEDVLRAFDNAICNIK